MTSHYYHLISAVNAFLFKITGSAAYSPAQVAALTGPTNQLKTMVDADLKARCEAVAAALQALEAATQALERAAQTAYINDPAKMGIPEFIPHNPAFPKVGEWGFKFPCLGRSIYEAIKALHTHAPLPGVVGEETAQSLFQIQWLMRPEAPGGGDDYSKKPCWPSCLVSSSSSSSS